MQLSGYRERGRAEGLQRERPGGAKAGESVQGRGKVLTGRRRAAKIPDEQVHNFRWQ